MNIFDCTLRDGGNVLGCGFTKELTISIIKGLIDCGITEIEFGNAHGIGAYKNPKNKTFCTDEEYLEAVQPFVGKAHLGMFCDFKNATPENCKLAKDAGLDFLRVGQNASDGAKSVEAVKNVKAAGLTCRYSLKKAYVCTPEELAADAKIVVDAGVDKITIMDSAGYMFPKDATEYVKALKAAVPGAVIGFHGHSNLGMSQANAVAAVEAGADEVDGGLLGMARSAGNCSTELAVAAMHRMGLLESVDLFKLLDYEDKELIPMMKPYGYHVAITPEELVLGFSGCHSHFLKQFKQVAEEKGVPLYKLIIETSKINKKNPSVELITEVAEKLK